MSVLSEPELLVLNEGEILTCPPQKELPFDSSKTSRIGSGGYGAVYKEVIAMRHFRYKPIPPENSPVLNETPFPIARKHFFYTPDFDREYAFLKRLNTSPFRHSGVIQELAVLIYNNKYNLLLPLANSDIAKLQVLIDFSSLSLKDLLNESSRIADAISWLHSGVYTPDGKPLIACHMDMKPSNILVYQNEAQGAVGTWILTDFSTSTLTTETGEDLLPAPKLVADVYTAPEIKEQPERNKASPECDVWSFGCILFEILLGYVDGREKSLKWKDMWGNMPCFYGEEMGEQVLGSKVQQWIALNVPADATDSRAVESCKKFILAILKIMPAERPTAKVLTEMLASIASQS